MDVEQRLLVHRNDVEFHGRRVHRCQATSGTATVAPTGSGSVTYTLSCSGAGGMASATTPMVTVNPSILSTLSPSGITTIGLTLDPIEHGGNPYGLTIARQRPD